MKRKGGKGKVKVIMAKKLLSDKFMKSKEGDYFDEKDYNEIVDYDCDCYYLDETGKKKLLFKFRKNVFPAEAELAARAYNITGNPFKSIEYNLEESLLDLEIRKSRLEQAVTSSEMFPDLTLGLKLTKFDVLSTANDFEVRATATSKLNFFDGFRRKYTVKGQSERIAALAAQLRNAKLLKDQRLAQYRIRYQNLDDEALIEVEKKQKSKNDWDIAKEMSSVTALDLGTEIRYASSILSSELRLMDIEAEKGLLLIQGISVQGKLSEFFIIPDQNTETVF